VQDSAVLSWFFVKNYITSLLIPITYLMLLFISTSGSLASGFTTSLNTAVALLSALCIISMLISIWFFWRKRLQVAQSFMIPSLAFVGVLICFDIFCFSFKINNWYTYLPDPGAPYQSFMLLLSFGCLAYRYYSNRQKLEAKYQPFL
jgi:hypothetical protein